MSNNHSTEPQEFDAHGERIAFRWVDLEGPRTVWASTADLDEAQKEEMVAKGFLIEYVYSRHLDQVLALLKSGWVGGDDAMQRLNGIKEVVYRLQGGGEMSNWLERHRELTWALRSSALDVGSRGGPTHAVDEAHVTLIRHAAAKPPMSQGDTANTKFEVARMSDAWEVLERALAFVGRTLIPEQKRKAADALYQASKSEADAKRLDFQRGESTEGKVPVIHTSGNVGGGGASSAHLGANGTHIEAHAGGKLSLEATQKVWRSGQGEEVMDTALFAGQELTAITDYDGCFNLLYLGFKATGFATMDAAKAAAPEFAQQVLAKMNKMISG